MLECLNDEKKEIMKLNIQLHRQKLLKRLENVNDTFIKPKAKLISNDLKQNNFKNLVTNAVAKSNLNKLVSNNGKKSSNFNHDVKPKIASSSAWKNPKRRSTINFTNNKNKSSSLTKTYERVINTKPKSNEVLTNIDIQKYKARSSLAVNQLQPNFKLNIQEVPLSNVEFKSEPLPEPNIETDHPEPPITVKKLKEQLIEELMEDDSLSSLSCSEEENEDNISVGSNENWNEVNQTHIENDLDDNDCSNSSLIEEVKYDGHKQLANDKSEDYLYHSGNSDNSVLDINYPTTSKRNETRKIKVLTKPQNQINKPKNRFRKPQDRDLHNAKERACREHIGKMFDVLRKSCSYLNSNKRVPSKHSILLAAKKECDLLKHFEKKMTTEKNILLKANDNLRKRIAHFVSKDSKLASLI